MGSAPEGNEAWALQAQLPWTSSSANTVFRLFDLPPELRDQVYDYSLTPTSTFKLAATDNPRRDETDNEHTTTTPAQSSDEIVTRSSPAVPSLLASIKFRPPINILLAGKALKKELGDRSKLAMTLVLKDNENYAFQPIDLPEPAKEVYWAELHLILFCHNCRPVHADERSCQAGHEISQHRSWIEKLLSTQLTKLRSLSLHVYLCYDYYRPSEKKTEPVPCEAIVRKNIQELYSLPRLKTLLLYKYSFMENPELDGPKVVLLEWPPKPQTENDEEDTAPQTEDVEVPIE